MMFYDADYLHAELSVLSVHLRMVQKMRLLHPNEVYQLQQIIEHVSQHINTENMHHYSASHDGVFALLHDDILSEKRAEDLQLLPLLWTGTSRTEIAVTTKYVWLRLKATHCATLVFDLIHALEVVAEKSNTVITVFKDPLSSQESAACEPVLLAHYLLSFVWSLLRDSEHLQSWMKRYDASPYGCGEGAGTSFEENDIQSAAHSLGFSRVMMNSINALQATDAEHELLFIMTELCSHVTEMISQLSSLILNNCNQQAWDQHDSGQTLLDIVHVSQYMDHVFPYYTSCLTACFIDKEKLYYDATHTMTIDHDALDWCVRHGIKQDNAQQLIQKCVFRANEKAILLKDLIPEEWEHIIGFEYIRTNPQRSTKDVHSIRLIVDSHGSIESRRHIGGTALKRVNEQLHNAQSKTLQLQTFFKHLAY